MTERTPAQMRAQWEARFDKIRTPREWAEFCAGMNTDGLERAFAFAMEDAFGYGHLVCRAGIFQPERITEARTIATESRAFVAAADGDAERIETMIRDRKARIGDPESPTVAGMNRGMESGPPEPKIVEPESHDGRQYGITCEEVMDGVQRLARAYVTMGDVDESLKRAEEPTPVPTNPKIVNKPKTSGTHDVRLRVLDTGVFSLEINGRPVITAMPSGVIEYEPIHDLRERIVYALDHGLHAEPFPVCRCAPSEVRNGKHAQQCHLAKETP